MRSQLSRLLTAAAVIICSAMTIGCDSVDDDRIPYCDVLLTFHTVADWNVYGVKGDAADYARYIYVRGTGGMRVPASFPFTDLDRTGYGGLLVVNDVMGNTLAYDLACPVEVSPTCRVTVPSGELYAECQKCGSTYDIYTNHGNPRSGIAADKGYGLKRYSVVSGGALDYKVVTR